ncbi:MAG: hypothetical protein ACP5T0_09865 [Verrucomicrobiia bacterium]
MPDYRKLNEILDKWGELTERERVSIQQADWAGVELAQKEKADLQPIISAHLNSLNETGNGNSYKNTLQWKQVLNKVSQLIESEKKNKQLIDLIIQKIVADRQMAEMNIKNLRKIRSAYGSENLPAWQAYT